MESISTTTDILAQLSKTSSASFIGLSIDSLTIKAEQYQANSVSFTDCTFTEGLEFRNVNFGRKIIFSGCKFRKAVVFVNSILNIPTVAEGIHFDNCDFESTFYIFKGNIQGGMSFFHCSFQQRVLLREIVIKKAYMEMQCNSFMQELEIVESEINYTMFKSNKFVYDVDISEVSGDSISFIENNVCEGDLSIDNSEFLYGLTFYKGEFKNTVHLNSVQTAELSINEGIFEKIFEVNYKALENRSHDEISSFNICNAQFMGGFNVLGYKNTAKSYSEILNCHIQTSYRSAGNISLSGLKIHQLALSGYSTVKMSFRELEIRELILNEFVNEAALIFSDVRAINDKLNSDHEPLPSILKIYDSNLGKAHFFSTNLGSFQEHYISNVILTEISTLGVTWFSPQQLASIDTEYYLRDLNKCLKTGDKNLILTARTALINWLNSRRAIYRQLKSVSQRQGDLPEMHRFQAHEMEFYQQITHYQRPRIWSEYLILLTSRSNKFGQSWTTALWLLIPFSFATYIPIGFLCSEKLDYNNFSLAPADLLINLKVVFWDNLKMWVILLNPAHRIKDLNDNIDQFPSIIYLFDLISRIIVSYFLFQIISAFRKFSK